MAVKRTGTASRVLVGVRLPAALARQLKVEAARRGTTAQAMVEAAVTTFLAAARKEAHHGTR
jgi:hypothetical protein